MGRKSVFDTLSAELRTELDKLILTDAGRTIDGFQDWLAEQGIQATRSATGRYLFTRRNYLVQTQDSREEQSNLDRLDRIQCLEIASRSYQGDSPATDLILVAEKLFSWAENGQK